MSVLLAGPSHGFAASSTVNASELSPFGADAQWIAAQPDPVVATPPNVAILPSAAASDPLPILRHSFTARGRNTGAKLLSAKLFISGLGQFEAHVNGCNVTESVLTPGWSNYNKRVYYDTFDVTKLIVPGENVIGVLLGNGMYNVASPANRYTKFRGSFGQPKLIAALVLTFSDGSEQRIVTGSEWKTTSGPITFANIYGGEDYDARLEQAGWDTVSFDDKLWGVASIVVAPTGKLEPETIPPVIANESYAPVVVTHPRPGVTIYDLGQNISGWPEIEVAGARGDTVRLLPGELLDADGLVTQRSGGASAKNPDFFTYTLLGGGVESWHPRFSYTGFRYVQVETSSATPDAAAPVVQKIAGRFLHDAFVVDGQFTSSSDMLNRIHTLIDRAILSNSFSVLTDCPTREKLGWLEQTHLAGASLMYNYNIDTLYAKIAADMRDAQAANGLVPDIAPEYPVFANGFRDSPEWGSAVILSPWEAYQFYGKLDLLRDEYPAMQRYVAYLRSKAQDHILAYGLGDWYDIGPKFPGVSQLTTSGVTGTAIYYQDLTALAGIATQLKRFNEANEYVTEADEVWDAFNRHFFHAETNQYDTGSQTANAMALALNLVPKDHSAEVLDNLVADIHAHEDHVTAGDVGFHYVIRALTDGGRSDVIYAILTRTDKPSYGDQLAHGATTLTEAWDSNPKSSQNHFMLGHAEEWFYRGLAGIRVSLLLEPSVPSDQHVIIAPAVVGDLAHVAASYHSKLGLVASAWSRAGDKLTMDVTLPVTGRIVIPEAFDKEITLDGKPIASTNADPVVMASTFDGKILYPKDPTYRLPAGTYHFESHR
jgi:hypothetical protein